MDAGSIPAISKKGHILFTLQRIKDGFIIRFTECYNGDEAEFCNDSQLEFSDSPYGPFWINPSKKVVEKARVTDTPWYNSAIDYPAHFNGFKSSDWKVVELVVKQEG